MNELAIVFDRIDIDTNKIIEAMNAKLNIFTDIFNTIAVNPGILKELSNNFKIIAEQLLD